MTDQEKDNVGSAHPSAESAPAADGGSRILALDGLRAVAILVVMVHHYSQEMTFTGFGDSAFFGVANSCWLGVDLFFVLSGFLITGILYDAKGAANYFSTFYVRRSLRIFPIYYVLLLAMFVILPAIRQPSLLDDYTRSHAGWFWLYGSNYLTGFIMWPDRAVVHLWSLAIEEHFYLIWPVVVFLCNKKQLLIGGAVIIVGAIVLRYQAISHGISATDVYVETQYRIDTLVLGGMLALAWRTPAARVFLTRHAGKAFVLLFAATCALLASRKGFDWMSWTATQHALGYTLIALFFASAHVLTLGLSPESPIGRLLSSAPARLVGRLSYGMYLFHLPLCETARALDLFPQLRYNSGLPSWPFVVVYIVCNAAVCTLLAWLTWTFFERHMLKLKDRFHYRKSGAKSGKTWIRSVDVPAVPLNTIQVGVTDSEAK